MRHLFASFVILLGGSSLVAAEPDATEAEPGAIVVYGGGDLSQWRGREDLWSVEDGAIVGRSTAENPLKGNTFLIWQGDPPGDFELTAQFKIEGGNSGIQYRSKVTDETDFVVGGYQADFDSTNTFAGILYEERGRGILAQRGQRVTINADGTKSAEKFADSDDLAKGIHPGQWNEFRVVADGNHLQHFINGAMTSEVIDNQSQRAAKDGIIALQLHAGPPMTVRFKNIKLRPIND